MGCSLYGAQHEFDVRAPAKKQVNVLMLLLLLNMTVFCMSSGALYLYIDVSTTEKIHRNNNIFFGACTEQPSQRL